MLSTGLLSCLPPDRAAFHIPMGIPQTFPMHTTGFTAPKMPIPHLQGGMMFLLQQYLPQLCPIHGQSRYLTGSCFPGLSDMIPLSIFQCRPRLPACFHSCLFPSLLPAKGNAEMGTFLRSLTLFNSILDLIWSWLPWVPSCNPQQSSSTSLG